MNRYPFGYGSPPVQLTLAELEQRQSWARLHPEFRRRLIAMMDEAQRQGRTLGIGGGWRSSASQENTFLARHERVRIGGCCVYKGQRYRLRRGAAHAAPPGRSYHESVPQLNDMAVAADLIGDLPWMNSVAHRYGFVHFASPHPLREPWHIQCSDLPSARSSYAGQQLAPFPLPEPRRTLKKGDKGDDVRMVQHVLATKAGQAIKVDGDFGAQTETGVVNLQRFFKLPVSKQVDPATWAVLDMLNAG